MKFSKTRNIKRKSKSKSRSRSKSRMAKGIVNNRGVDSKLHKKSRKTRYRKKIGGSPKPVYGDFYMRINDPASHYYKKMILKSFPIIFSETVRKNLTEEIAGDYKIYPMQKKFNGHMLNIKNNKIITKYNNSSGVVGPEPCRWECGELLPLTEKEGVIKLAGFVPGTGTYYYTIEKVKTSDLNKKTKEEIDEYFFAQRVSESDLLIPTQNWANISRSPDRGHIRLFDYTFLDKLNDWKSRNVDEEINIINIFPFYEEATI